MPLFKKKKKEEANLELPELPSFSEMHQIKQALKPVSPRESGLPEMPEARERPSAPTMPPTLPSFSTRRVEPEPEKKSEPMRVPLTQEISTPSAPPTPPAEYHERYPASEPRMARTERRQAAKPKEPIFIKIDNFNDALSNFELIKERLIEIDELLKKLRETRLKEQEEFDSWEKEVIDIKSRVGEIDEKLFSTLE